MTVCTAVVSAAESQAYRVDFAATGNRERDAALKRNSRLETLRVAAPVGATGLVRRAQEDVARLKTVLDSFGYYQGDVSITFDGVRLGDPRLVTMLNEVPANHAVLCDVAVTPGPLYHLGRIDVETVPPDQQGIGVLNLAPGAPAVAADVLGAAARLLESLQDDGFAFAVVENPVANEDPTGHTLDIAVRVRPGPRVVIGSIGFVGLERLHESALRARLRVHSGDRYSAAALEKARQDLLGIGSIASVGVQLGEADGEGRIPVRFQVRERPRHAFGIRAAYSSDLGGSSGVTWTDRDVLHGAEQLDLTASVINFGGDATKRVGYDFNAKYLTPDFWRREQSLQLSVQAVQQSLQAYDQKAQTATETLLRKLSDSWSISLGVSAGYNAVRQQGDTHVYTLLALPFSVFYDSTALPTPLSDTAHGMRVGLTLAPTVSFGNPNARFLVIQATTRVYLDLRPLLRTEAGRSVLALRALGGLAAGAGQFDLPPDQRFYAGGSSTIRGFRYQAVGPTFADGSPAGGTAMGAVGIEFRQRLGRSFAAAVFADGGAVSQSAAPFAGGFRVGMGAGLRYYTPIGPIRFDVAVPTRRRQGDDRFEIYVGLGQTF